MSPWIRLTAELLGRLDAHVSLSADESASLQAARAALAPAERRAFDASRSAACLAEREASATEAA